MMSLSSATEYARGMIDDGRLPNADAANVEIIRMMGVRIIEGSIPQQVRKALSAGVKANRIGRIPKKGLLPEAFFHPNAKDEALEQRERVARSSIEAIRKVCGTSPMIVEGK